MSPPKGVTISITSDDAIFIRESIREVVITLILSTVIVIFIAQNTNDVSVDFLFFNGEWPLWLVVVAVILLTLVAERLGLWIWRRSRQNKES